MRKFFQPRLAYRRVLEPIPPPGTVWFEKTE
jgi:hypothetical protein